MSDGAISRLKVTAQAGALVLSGSWLVSTIGEVDKELRRLDGDVAEVDMGGIDEIDTVGAWAAMSHRQPHRREARGRQQARRAADGSARHGRRFRRRAARASAADRARVLRHRDRVQGARRGTIGAIGFLGQFISAAGTLIRHPRRFRTKAFVHQMELVGISALGIIGLMSFLIGIVIAQQGAVQLAPVRRRDADG